MLRLVSQFSGVTLMAELSPHLNDNPIDKAFTLGLLLREQNRAESEACEITITQGGRLVHTTGALRVSSLKNHVSEAVVYPIKGKEIVARLGYTRFIKRVPYRVAVRFRVKQIPIGKSGRVRIPVNGPAVLSSGILRKARSRVVRFAKSPYKRRSSQPQNRPLRESPEIANRSFLRTFESGIGGVRNGYTQTVVPVLDHSRTWSGSRTPNYGKLKPGQLPVNPHAVKIVEVLENKYSKYQTQAASGNWELNIFPYTEVYTPPLSPIAIHLPLAEQKAIRKLIDAAGAGIQANLAQNLAQYGQVTSMIANNAMRIVNALKFVKQAKRLGNKQLYTAAGILTAGRGNQGINMNALNSSKSVASNWLELQYGWKPLLSDIKGTLEAIPTLSNVGSFVRSVEASASAAKESVVAYPPGDGVIGFGNGGKTTFINKTRTKFKIRFRMSDPTLAFVAQTGFTNPLNLAWEILPFSFVADWFLPIGPYLETLSAWHGLTFIGGSRTNFTRVWMASTIAYSGPSAIEPSVNVLKNASYREEQVWLNRVGLTDFPSQVAPVLNLRGLSGGVRAQNAIALLTGAFKSFR